MDGMVWQFWTPAGPVPAVVRVIRRSPKRCMEIAMRVARFQMGINRSFLHSGPDHSFYVVGNRYRNRMWHVIQQP